MHVDEGKGRKRNARSGGGRESAVSIYNVDMAELVAGEAGVEVSPGRGVPAPERPVVYDTTLRDGEQMPGVRFTPEQKVRIARLLDEARVPQIEAGFPAVSGCELDAIKAVTSLGLDADMLVLTRLTPEDVELARACDADWTLLFIASSPSHLKYKLRTDVQTIAGRIPELVDLVKGYGMVPSFSTEDSTRTPLAHLELLNAVAMEAGAARVGVTDTVGCASPHAISRFVADVKRFTPAALSVHLHNDFGMATANAVMGVAAGAEAVAVTVNGMGERAGNVPLEEFVMSLEALYGVDMGMDTTLFGELSRTVAECSGVPVAPCKPLVGPNAFTHESGIHVAAILEDPFTYEPITPERVGNCRRLTLGKHSGLSYVMDRLRRAGLRVDEDQSQRILDEVKRMGELNGRVDDDQFCAIVHQVTGDGAELPSPGREGSA
jgi:isopropylmalate/homocitrate/citramalate synthase